VELDLLKLTICGLLMININNIINAPLISSPWSHKIIDNIFDDKSFEIINQAASHLSHLCLSDKTIPVHIDEAIELGISDESANLILDTADLLLYNLKEIVGKNCRNGAFRGGYFIMPKCWSDSRYMQVVAHCRFPEKYPAIIHVDGTSRVQTVPRDGSGIRKLLEAWYAETGCPMLLNTSLNIRGEPMVNDRADADRFEREYGVQVVS
jgi:hypothetical protein